MKRNLKIGMMIATISFANFSHADFTFYSDTNVCSDVTGHWVGQGKAFNRLIGECKYSGVGTIGVINSSGHFTLEVNAKKQSGSLLCPDHHAAKFDAVCDNGKVTVKTEYGQLMGNFSRNSGDASGDLTVSPGIIVQVSIQFNRSN